ncbi:MAG TPA: hypothetical protein VNE39_25230 [Planctomycetota bacterium]|nr:hypothetical protein [Planctomycetota bacterium]
MTTPLLDTRSDIPLPIARRNSMRTLWCSTPVLGCVLEVWLWTVSLAGQPTIEVRFTPVAGPALLAGPIPVLFSVRSFSDGETAILMEYPDALGVSLTCNDRDATPAAPPLTQGMYSSDPGVELRTLGPREELRITFPLKQRFRFHNQSPRKFTVSYRVRYREDAEWFSQRPERSLTGQFQVSVSPGQLTDAAIAGYAKPLVELKVIGRGTRLDDDQLWRLRRTVDLLSYVDDPRVVTHLELGATLDPYSAHTVLQALAKFAGTDAGRDAILRIGKSGFFYVCETMFDVCDEQGITVPREVYRELLSSDDHAKRYAALVHLWKRGDRSLMAYVEPLKNDPNPQVAELAAEVEAGLKEGRRPPREVFGETRTQPGHEGEAEEARGHAPGILAPVALVLAGVVIGFLICRVLDRRRRGSSKG